MLDGRRSLPSLNRESVQISSFPLNEPNPDRIHPRAQVQANASYLQLVVAGTNEFVDIVPQAKATHFELAKLAESSPHDVRMTLLCCPTAEAWPLLLDDREFYSGLRSRASFGSQCGLQTRLPISSMATLGIYLTTHRFVCTNAKG